MPNTLFVSTAAGVAPVAAHMDLTLVVLAVILSLVDLGLKVWAVIDVVPRDRDAIRWHNRWVWLAIVLLVNLLGPVAYLAFGRTHAPVSEEEAARLVARPAADTAAAAVDLLYGPGQTGEAGGDT